jgi:hypothetical protein
MKERNSIIFNLQMVGKPWLTWNSQQKTKSYLATLNELKNFIPGESEELGRDSF